MSKHFLKQLGLLVLLIIISGGVWFFTQGAQIKQEAAQDSTEIQRVRIGNKIFNIELADSPAERQRGLSGHSPLEDDEGMLFIFEKADTYGFWMKDMLFGLDILWLDQDGRIIYIEREILPETYPKVFTPKEPALYVLEINAGLTDKKGFKTGDRVQFLK